MDNLTTQNHSTSCQADCLIPVYNEENRILSVIDKLLKIGSVASIVCVDDGSVDNTFEQLSQLQARHPAKIKLLSLPENQGKSGAVKAGLKLVETEDVLLFDADVRNLSCSELTEGIEIYLQNRHIRMLLFCEVNELMISRILRFNVVFTGNRLMRTKDLRQVFLLDPERFQLEAAINHYMSIEQYEQSIFYYNYSALNTHKVRKAGYVEGIKQELLMCKDVIQFAGPIEVIKQISTFARQEYQL